VSAAASVMLWAQRILLRRQAPAHQLLEIAPDATMEEAQLAFHKIARIAHPDLHRHGLSAEDLELLTTAYAVVAGAYQTYRSQAVAPANFAPANVAPANVAREPTPAAGAPTVVAPPEGDPEQAMSSKALLYYRKAEVAWKRGDLRSAMLQIKLAIAADPVSVFLKGALAQVQAEGAKSK
jgi:hypothetical protein